MPFLNDDGTEDTWKGYIRQCDHCGAIEKVFDEAKNISIGRGDIYWAMEQEIRELFCGVRSHGLPDVLCIECMNKVMPSLYKLRDVIELDIFVNRLKGAINEKRKQRTKDNRPTSHPASERRQRGSERRYGHRPSNGASQVGEEHF